MITSKSWTILDETVLFFAQSLEFELRRTHGVLFAAAFLDEFEHEVSNIALQSVRSQLPKFAPPA